MNQPSSVREDPQSVPQVLTSDREEIVGAVLTVSDVTKRRQDERRLRELNETLGELVAERTQERDRIWQVSQDMLGVADANGVWISINPAWPRILGWDYEEILGKTSEWLEHPEDREKTRAEVARLAAGGLTLAVRRQHLWDRLRVFTNGGWLVHRSP